MGGQLWNLTFSAAEVGSRERGGAGERRAVEPGVVGSGSAAKHRANEVHIFQVGGAEIEIARGPTIFVIVQVIGDDSHDCRTDPFIVLTIFEVVLLLLTEVRSDQTGDQYLVVAEFDDLFGIQFGVDGLDNGDSTVPHPDTTRHLAGRVITRGARNSRSNLSDIGLGTSPATSPTAAAAQLGVHSRAISSHRKTLRRIASLFTPSSVGVA